MPAAANILKEVSVVGGDLDDMALSIETEALHHSGDVALRVGQPTG